MICRVCHGTSGRTHVAREMMFGLRERFPYFECDGCGCLQIVEEPPDLGRYYPPGYAEVRRRPDQGLSPWRALLFRARARRALGRPSLLGRLAERRLGPCRSAIFGSPDPYAWLRACGADRGARILDVGCAGGALLLELRRDGFRNLAGVDPFVQRELDYGGGLRIHKTTLDAMPGGWDVIMMHHALEHVMDPAATLGAATERLRPGGHLVVRMPMVDSEAWRTYGVDWVQLDAPRHLTLHTRKSFDMLVDRAGLERVAAWWDSGAFQFLGSEQYRRDVPLTDERSFTRGRRGTLFSAAQVEDFERRAEELNRQEQGDQACFVLRRPR